ncbi:uncharacterized protein [Gossypium hirsutum]|uniref:Retrotransposon gag domain-containing protein n=1 Tax=Gossypium hirsutum TaxID=3635 RepID=A0A1U8NFP7_GOSHI|nr:uncharacterized protein LOC107947864 [Gossypium hirsutum]
MGASYNDVRRLELLNLTQEDRSVVEYEAKFLRLSRYARGMVATEYKRCVRFEDGLRDSLRVLIAPQRERDFSALVEKAKITEEVKRSERQNHEKGKAKRDSKPSNTGMRPKKKARTDGPVRSGPTVVVPIGVAMCQLCNRRHPGECGRATGACLSYREGYSSYLGAKDRLGVVMVWVEVGEYQAEVLARLRRGSLHLSMLYITVRMEILQISSLTLRISCESTSSEMSVVSLLRQSIRVSKLFRNVPLEVQRTVFLADLMELPFGESDLILEKLVKKGCKAYLAYISVSDSVDSSIKDIRTVKEFPDVFPKELPRLPPSREVEFRIELIPGTAQVSIATYRMAPKELTELKA